ncbi:RING finger protein [Niveomyces insectorum RCEF 264]|uniref:RBR-type E3 ubiquitin transferase n=1 Tax=Niveomyces insectorum RCEF 264 TaxID=1081102 RepID=A0A167SI61_9HYPO|nr:RING finger protein [Niveomyces insectorum RCEF 264]
MASRLFRPAAFAARSATASTRTAAVAPSAVRRFHAGRPLFVKVGQEVPDLEVLVENSPGNKVNLAKEFQKADGLIIGVPGAYSGACSQTHVPSYLLHPKLKEAGQVFVVAVNDAFVVKAWSDVLDPAHESKIRFLGDPAGEFTKALDLAFDATAIFGNPRSKRYALVIENGRVKKAYVEPDNTGTNVSLADEVLKRKAAEAPIPAEGRSLRQRRLPPEGPNDVATSMPVTPATTSKSAATVSPVAAVATAVAAKSPTATGPPPPPSLSALQKGPLSPQTTASLAMDSDDDFMSNLSSEDDALKDDSDIDDFDFDEEPDDVDIGLSKEISEEKRKKSYEVDYKVYEPKDLDKQQDALVSDVNMILEMRPEDAAILLRYFRWNRERLIEEYMDRPNKVLEAAGLGPSVGPPPRAEVVPGFVCDICCEDGDGLQSFAMKCGHRYCVDCYRHYLAQKIREEGEAARIQCPTMGCGRILDARSLDVLVTPELAERYHELLNRTYVEDRDSLKWCPAPDCANAVDCHVKKKDLDRIVPTVECACGYRFCFGCSLRDHQPAPCKLVKQWLKKCADDSETANWISANTKECPRCNSTIEKNGGCNHMTCRKCKHEFCWMCMGLWSEHGTSWYNCNRFEEKSGTEARDAQARSRVSLERYLHYYNRYANHEQSARLDKDIYTRTEQKMVQLQTSSGMSWIEVQYLQAASQALQTCRQTLKWTYAFAFYLARNNVTEMFEDNQKDLEMAVEALSEMFEKPVGELSDVKMKVDIMDKTAYCTKRRVILLEYTADNLANDRWTFNNGDQTMALASAPKSATRGSGRT